MGIVHLLTIVLVQMDTLEMNVNSIFVMERTPLISMFVLVMEIAYLLQIAPV
jgi:hypothetical protein